MLRIHFNVGWSWHGKKSLLSAGSGCSRDCEIGVAIDKSHLCGFVRPIFNRVLYDAERVNPDESDI